MISKVSLVLTSCLSLSAAADVQAGSAGTANVPRDPEVAVAEEYQHFKSQGTAEALELFIARHPEHPLASKAREEIKMMKR